MNQWVFETNETNFDSDVIERSREVPILLDFWAPWCGPCRVMEPILDELAAQNEGRVKFTKMNVDDNQETAARFDILSIPTLLVFDGGEVQKKLIGAVPRRRLEDELSTWLG
jgi:thioredoxin 1